MPSNLLTADTSFPSLEGKSTKDQVDVITNYLFLLLENLKYTLANLGSENFNDSELDGLKKSFTSDVEIKVQDLDGNLTVIKQSVDSLTFTVVSLSGEFSQVQQTIDGLQVTTSDGTTYISGDNIKSGDIEGSRLICNLNSSSGSTDGELLFRYMGKTVGRVQMDTYGNLDGGGDESKYRVFIEALENFVLKLISDKDLSVTSKTGNIYIGANAGRVNVNGENGVWLRPYSGYTYQFQKDGIYFNGTKIVSV